MDSKAWRIVGVVILAPFMTQMDSTVVNVSLSTIQHDLQAPLASTHWIISGYLLALALMLPLNGWLVDRLGCKRLYLICFAAFTMASFLCGAAHTMPQLIAARVLQGIAGGLLAPLTQLMIARVAGNQMARVIGYAAAPILLAPLVGPILAGAILKYAGWPWLFYVNLPVGVIALVLAQLVLPAEEAVAVKRPFDLPGFLLISPGLVLLLYGLQGKSFYWGAAPLLMGVILLGTFFWHAHRNKARALIDLDLFRNRVFSVATTTQFLANGILYAGQFLVPLYLTTGAGLSPSEAGWVLAPMGIGMLCVYPFMGYLTETFGCRSVASIGVFVNLVGTLPFLWMANHAYSAPLAIAGLFVRGTGQGATGIPSLAAAYASVGKERLNLAATAMNIVQRLGGPIMTTALAVVLSLSGRNLTSGMTHSFFLPFVALLFFQLLVVASAIRLPVRMPQGAT